MVFRKSIVRIKGSRDDRNEILHAMATQREEITTGGYNRCRNARMDTLGVSSDLAS
jgi:threonine synthase